MENLLPHDGTVHYFGRVIPNPDACFDSLFKQIKWQNDEVMLFGKRIVTKRKTAWYGDQPFRYTYSKITRTALPWTGTLLELKRLVEKLTDQKYNSCLLNLYHDGSEGMGWHSDDEKEIVRHSSIASVSLGADRKFYFRHKHGNERIAVQLENGSVLEMKGAVQEKWQHSIPKALKVTEPRINLTFRKLEV